MLLRHSLGLEAEAVAVENAVHEVIAEGARTADLGAGAKSISTSEMGSAIRSKVVAHRR
jgi:3-isopropylmalate dehydrogenase